MKGGSPFGRNIHFGIREHAMGAIANGIALYGLSKIYVGTFLVFSDYMRGSVRLSALMDLPVTYVFTHDSIGLGEDGPTHQPIEHAAALRAIPELKVIRPADANEVAEAWRHLIANPQPAALLLSRQNLPVLDIDPKVMRAGLPRGAYLAFDPKDPVAIVIATGSELNLAMDAAKELQSEGVHIRVVSAPSLEWFAAQPQEYRDSVLPPTIKTRVSVEAGISQGWHRWIGEAGVSISIEHFGASASAEVLFREFGFTVEKVKEAVKASIAKA
jgi:transketolase